MGEIMGGLRLRSRIWVVDDRDRIIIGEGRMEILENIERTGSINQTAKRMKMSYKGVWSKIKATETYWRKKIVHADRKTGTRLTDEGKELLEKYRQLHEACHVEQKRIFQRLFEADD
jgi:molybdate transport system regulatory protein